MKICLITSVPLNPPWDQGDKNLAYTLTQAMGEHQFRVFTLGGARLPEGENLNLLPLYKSRNPSIVQKARVYWYLLGHSSFNSKGMAQMANGKPDLYHLIYRPTPMSSRLNRLLPEFRYRPTVHTVSSATAPGQLSPELFFANRLVAISRYALRALKKLGFENVTYIPPGIDIESWADLASQRNYFKSRLGLADKPVLLYPGHYAPGYGINVIRNALPLITAEIPDVQILFACRLRSQKDRLSEQAFRQGIAQQGLERNVHYFNTVNDMRLLIGASDLTLLPLETMQDKVDIPITLLESLAAGVPVILSDLAPMNELISPLTRQGETAGLTIPPGDAETLAQSVVNLLNDIQIRNRLAQNGQTLVRKEYNLQHTAAQYNRIYHELQGCLQ